MSIALHEALARVAPIAGVSIGDEADRSTWTIHYDGEATPEQIAAAEAVVRDFNPIVNAQPTGENAALVSRVAQLEALIASLRNR